MYHDLEDLAEAVRILVKASNLICNWWDVQPYSEDKKKEVYEVHKKLFEAQTAISDLFFSSNKANLKK